MAATQRAKDEPVEVQIRGLMMDPVTNMPIIVLKEVTGETVLPIWVGGFEANAIAAELDKGSLPRPMTHDLLGNAIRALNAELTRVVISALREDTFFAVVELQQQGEPVALDARPSDAIALALRWDCPIFVAESVLAQSRQATEGNNANVNADQLRRWLETLNEEDTGGRYKM